MSAEPKGRGNSIGLLPIEAAARLLARAQRVACLTGAGVSAESGVATFRDAQSGLWSKFDPQQLASQAGFASDPGLVWRWYMARLGMVESAQPNAGHRALAQLENLVPSFTLITQNVDDLHERAGSRNVLHLHGSLLLFRCNECSAGYGLRDEERNADLPPTCPICGGWVRPDVVWFGEGLPGHASNRAWLASERCEVMLVAGTSAVVYPAAQLPFVAKEHGAAVIDVNPELTPISQIADLFLQGRSGEVLPQIAERVAELK